MLVSTACRSSSNCGLSRQIAHFGAVDVVTYASSARPRRNAVTISRGDWRITSGMRLSDARDPQPSASMNSTRALEWTTTSGQRSFGAVILAVSPNTDCQASQTRSSTSGTELVMVTVQVLRAVCPSDAYAPSRKASSSVISAGSSTSFWLPYGAETSM